MPDEIDKDDKQPRCNFILTPSLRFLPGTVVLAICVSVTWVCAPKYRQYAAIRDYEQAGGRIVTIKRRPAWWPWQDPPNETNAYMRMFNEPIGAYADDTVAISDADLVNFRALPTLRAINLSRTQVTDEGMKDISRVSSLETLLLVETSVSDVGLARLKELRQLRLLKLTGTRVTEAGIAELKRALPALKVER